MAGWSDRQTWQARDDQARWADLSTEQLRDLIASERERGKAFGVYAEAARRELAKRGEQA
jgi:hypothetical protein